MNNKILMVLHDLRVGNGIATCIQNYYAPLIKNGFKIDFLLERYIESPFTSIVKEHGSIFIISRKEYIIKKEKRDALESLLKTNCYDIIHVNQPGPYGFLVLKAAKKCHIPIRFYHCHNPRNTSSLKAMISSAIFNPLCIRNATDYIACSKYAGDSVFGKRNYSLLKNCIDADSFQYDPIRRQKLRKQLSIADDVIVLGAVGRLEDQKNPIFTMQCFEEYLSLNRNSVFVWVGDGSLSKNVKQYINKKGLNKKVYLVGTQDNISEWYSMMDIFLLPSKFEGFGIAFIEAQASGLNVFCSEGVPFDINISPLIHYLSLSASPKTWADAIAKAEPNNDRSCAVNYVKKAGFDVNSNNTSLEDIYVNALLKDRDYNKS